MDNLQAGRPFYGSITGLAPGAGFVHACGQRVKGGEWYYMRIHMDEDLPDGQVGVALIQVRHITHSPFRRDLVYLIADPYVTIDEVARVTLIQDEFPMNWVNQMEGNVATACLMSAQPGDGKCDPVPVANRSQPL